MSELRTSKGPRSPVSPSAPTISRRQLVDSLEESTALINRLRVRCQVYETEVHLYRERLKRAEQEVKEVKSDYSTQKLFWALGGVMLAIIIYGMLSWYQSPEMAYIRSRRDELLNGLRNRREV